MRARTWPPRFAGLVRTNKTARARYLIFPIFTAARFYVGMSFLLRRLRLLHPLSTDI